MSSESLPPDIAAYVGDHLLSVGFNPVADASPYIYGLRLIAFLLIIRAVVVKNRETIR